MKRAKKLFILLLVVCQMTYGISPFTVKAAETVTDEFNPNGSGIVWSEACVEGWELEWVSC